MTAAEIRLACLQLAASIVPEGSGNHALTMAALQLEHFVTDDRSAEAIQDDMREKRFQQEERMWLLTESLKRK